MSVICGAVTLKGTPGYKIMTLHLESYPMESTEVKLFFFVITYF